MIQQHIQRLISQARPRLHGRGTRNTVTAKILRPSVKAFENAFLPRASSLGIYSEQSIESAAGTRAKEVPYIRIETYVALGDHVDASLSS